MGLCGGCGPAHSPSQQSFSPSAIHLQRSPDLVLTLLKPTSAQSWKAEECLPGFQVAQTHIWHNVMRNLSSFLLCTSTVGGRPGLQCRSALGLLSLFQQHSEEYKIMSSKSSLLNTPWKRVYSGVLSQWRATRGIQCQVENCATRQEEKARFLWISPAKMTSQVPLQCGGRAVSLPPPAHLQVTCP